MEESIVLNGEVKLKKYGTNYSGKHNGWAYQFLNDDYEGIHLGVCCKDFLQDIVWSELTQKSMKVHNQPSSYLGVLDKQERLILCLYPHTMKVTNEEIVNMQSCLEAFLNEIELLKGFDFSVVHGIEDKLVIEFSKQWISKPYLFSLFTLLIRIGLYYDGNLETYIQNPYKTGNIHLDSCDTYYLRNNYQKILDVINNKAEIVQKDWVELELPYDVHDSGFFTQIGALEYEDEYSEEY